MKRVTGRHLAKKGYGTRHKLAKQKATYEGDLSHAQGILRGTVLKTTRVLSDRMLDAHNNNLVATVFVAWNKEKLRSFHHRRATEMQTSIVDLKHAVMLTPAPHAILTQLTAGDTVYQAGELPKRSESLEYAK